MLGRRITRRRFLALTSAAAIGLALFRKLPLSAQGTRLKLFTRADRKAAADRMAAQRASGRRAAAVITPTPGGVPDYFGYSNWANSPQAVYDVTVTIAPVIGDPTGSGATATAVIAATGASGIAVTSGGAGYTKVPTVKIVSGGVTIATATATIANGAVTSIGVPSGSGDFSTAKVVIMGGGGTGATARIGAAQGAIAGITVTNSGSGYTATPIVTISSGTGSGATAMATISNGQVIAITVTNPGSGYGLLMDSGKIRGIRKFVDKVAGLGAGNANALGQYIPIATPGTLGSDPNCDYYEIELVQYQEQMHSDLPTTTLRGYRQTNGPDTAPHYLGPLIVARRNRPVRIKFTNTLPTGAGGDLFLPVDTTVMGAGPFAIDDPNNPGTPLMGDFTQNRATLHLHGGFVPWISDGTPHQWITPAGESTAYPKGVSVYNVPDMPNPGDGSMTFYYNNEQSARLMFYHDHSFGITRLNVYAGEAAGYLLTDDVEQDLINGTNVSGVNPNGLRVLPNVGIPLILQDKSFVDPYTIASTDPTWMWGTGASLNPQPPGVQGIARAPKAGDLWYPHVYVPAQNPADPSGANAYGRWHYAPYFWPPATNLLFPPVPNPYLANGPWEAPTIPGTPNPSMPGEAFMDTAVVNGTVYPYLEVEPKVYRFRILNAADDRFFSLQWYLADPTVTTFDGRTNTELKMVPARPDPTFPPDWPVDGREGGVPDPTTMGPDWIQIGTEGGFLPKPAVVPNQPITWNLNPTTFNFGNVEKHALLLGCAERADVLVDFSAFAGKTLVLYNDAPAAFPALDSRYDYYTGNPDQTDTGGAPTTLAGFGPNTRTIMQVRVGTTVTTPFSVDLPTLETVWAKSGPKRGVFEASQDPILIPQADYDSAYQATFAPDAFIRQSDLSKTFTTVSGNLVNVPFTSDPALSESELTVLPFQPKAIQDEMGEAYDDYGRMNGLMGLELRNTSANQMNFVLLGYASPPVEILVDSGTAGEPVVVPHPTDPLQPGTIGDGTQFWRITHNGVDTHPIHFHLFNVQLINRVAWDGAILPPDPNELGWKETIRVNPLEHMIVAMRPILPTSPFAVPNSVRLIDPTMMEGEVLRGGPLGFADPRGTPVAVVNRKVNYGHEYVYHCHILAHEEMDMMHPVIIGVAPAAPTNFDATGVGASVNLTWTNNANNNTGFTIQRSTDPAFPAATTTTIPVAGAAVTNYSDTPPQPGTYYYRLAASNVVGYTEPYPPGTAGFPHPSVNSAFVADPNPVII